MIADLKSYPAYKDTDLPWMGSVPRHWDLKPAFAAFAPVYERNHGMKESRVLSLSYGRIIVKPVERLRGLVPESFETYQVVGPGDVVIRTTDLQNDRTSVRVAIVRDQGIITSAYLSLRPVASMSSGYGHRLLGVWDATKGIYGYGSGLRQSLDFAHFKRMPVPVPPADEQAAIVRFLDWANSRLDRAVQAKRKVIALLNEQKQAIVHRAVTRGLNPNAPLRPSSIDWTAEIPEEWEEYPLRRLATCENSGSFGHDSEPGAEELPVATTAQIDRDGKFDVSKMPRRAFTSAEVERFCCKPGDILVVKSSGSAANVISGKCGIVGVDTPRFVFSNFLARFRADSAIVHPRYLWLLLRSYVTRERVKRMVSTTTYPNLRMGEYRSAVLPVPPLDEQRRILEVVGLEVESVERTISHLEREIGLLREYHTRLVADVVTGKLDVREAAARLPDAVSPDDVEGDADLLSDPDVAEEEVLT